MHVFRERSGMMKGKGRLEEIKGREIERQERQAFIKKQACVLTEFAVMEMLSRSYSKCRMVVRMHSWSTSASRHPRLAPSAPPIVPSICCSQLWSPTAAPCLKKKKHLSALTSMKQCGLKRTPLFSSEADMKGTYRLGLWWKPLINTPSHWRVSQSTKAQVWMLLTSRNCTEQSITIIIGWVPSQSLGKRCCE